MATPQNEDNGRNGTVLSVGEMKRARITVSYILFESRFADGFHCVVPKSHPIPEFLVGPSWKFKGTLRRELKASFGFSEGAARDAVELDGCYFFFPRARRR